MMLAVPLKLAIIRNEHTCLTTMHAVTGRKVRESTRQKHKAGTFFAIQNQKINHHAGTKYLDIDDIKVISTFWNRTL